MEIGKLQVLQTLDLGKTCAKLPSSVIWLGHLIFLHVSPGIELPAGLRNLTSLEELTGVSMGCFCVDLVKELAHLTNLRVLDIFWTGSNEKKEDHALVESLCNLRKLQSLEIHGPGEFVYLGRGWLPPQQLRRLVLRGWLQTLPAWFSSSSLPLLSYLHINVREVWLEDIQIIGMLPALRFVYLRAGVDLATEQVDVEKFVLSADAFPCAIECVFLDVTMVPNFTRGAMPMVQSLRFGARVLDIIRGDFDWSMRNLPSLEKVYIDFDRDKASYQEYMESQHMLIRAAKEHPNNPTLKGIVSGADLSMRSCIPLTRGDVVGESIGEASISPVASNRFSCMFWSFLVQMKLEMKLILSTRIFRCLSIGSVLLYIVFCICFRQFKNH